LTKSTNAHENETITHLGVTYFLQERVPSANPIETCSYCQGSGQLYSRQCTWCKGRGFVPRDRAIVTAL
jgi:DnaJ-class molecular chaperone